MMTLFLYKLYGADKRRLLKAVHDAANSNPAFRAFRRFLREIAAKISLVGEMEVSSAKNAVRIPIQRFLARSEERSHFGLFFRLSHWFVSIIHAVVHLRSLPLFFSWAYERGGRCNVVADTYAQETDRARMGFPKWSGFA
jgi:hypothetical protein